MTTISHDRAQTVLVIAADHDRTADARLLEQVRDFERALVVAPTTPSPTARWIVDDEEAAGRAAARSRAVAAVLRNSGLDVEARVGDPDPIQAAADGIATEAVDAVVILAADTGRPHRPNLGSRTRRLGRPTAVIRLRPRRAPKLEQAPDARSG
jgi:hypothetical protein